MPASPLPPPTPSPSASTRWIAQTQLTTPLGPLLAACTTQGLGGLWFAGQAHHPVALDAPNDADHPWLQATARALQQYWRGDAPDLPPLDLQGTAFQQAVWAALLRIPTGQTTTYGALAQALQRPTAARAIGAAVGRNPVSVLVPCHRVMGTQGRLTGYAGGLERKRALLDWECHGLPPSLALETTPP